MIAGLTLGELVNAASGALFFLTGLAVLLLARRSAVRLLGVTIALWGVSYPVAYFSSGGGPWADALRAGLSAAFLLVSVGVAWSYPERASKREAVRLGIVLALAVSWGVSRVWSILGRGASWEELLAGGRGPPLATIFNFVMLAFLPTAFALRAIGRPEAVARLSGLSLAFGLYGTYNAARIIVWLAEPGLPMFLLLAMNLLPAGVWLFLAAAGGAPRLARNTALAIAGAGLLGASITALIGSAEAAQLGIPGALRTACWSILALAILRHGLIERPLTGFAVSRGPIAAASLAALFIVAQITQEFLTAEYGLLMGGIVAGALLFAANPIQRMMERVVEGRSHGARDPTTTSPSARGERELAYREAVRLALRDRQLTRDEERHLLRLAYHLGLPAPRAMEIHDEVERELGNAA